MIIIQNPPAKKSRTVTERDLVRVMEAAEPMQRLCFSSEPNQKTREYDRIALALAHCQVFSPTLIKKALRFYVMSDGEIIINPRIIRHTRHTEVHKEACMSFKGVPAIKVERWPKCEIEYQGLRPIADKTTSKIIGCELSPVITKNLSGIEAKIVQHEIDHFDGINIYQS